MPFFLRARGLAIATGAAPKVLLSGSDARHFGIRAGEKVTVSFGRTEAVATVDVAEQRITRGTLGLYREVRDALKAPDGAPVSLALARRPDSLRAVRRKLFGHTLSREEFTEIIRDIVSGALDPIPLTYFVAASFFYPYTLKELTDLTRAMAENGMTLKFPGNVADKHSIGGLAGNRTTMIVTPIIAAAGLTIPKTSSRAITSPSGTADTMEVLAPVTKTAEEIKKIVAKAHGCMVWGGGLDLAPADDKIIQVSSPLGVEPYTKMMVSIMAKKVAMGIRSLVIDMPYGQTTKVPTKNVAQGLARTFVALGKQFHMKVRVVLLEAKEPVGRGVGPALEARDVLRVLQQKASRPHDLERKSLMMAGALLELAGKSPKGKGKAHATVLLRSGRAWKAMQRMIAVQGGDPKVDANTLTTKAKTKRIHATRAGTIDLVDNRAIDELCRTLGAPRDKLAGVFLHRRIGEKVERGWKLYTLYAATDDRLALGLEALKRTSIFRFKT